MATESIQGLRYPAAGDPPDGPNGIKNLADDVVTRTNMRFATAAARDAAVTSPVAGMECYVGSGSAGLKYVYHNGGWKLAWSDTGWLTTGIAVTGNTNFTVNAYSLRRIGAHVKGRISVTFSASATALSSDASGDFANVALPTIPAEWSPSAYAERLVMERGGGAMHFGWAETTGQLRLTASSLQSAQVLVPGATYLIYLDHFVG